MIVSRRRDLALTDIIAKYQYPDQYQDNGGEPSNITQNFLHRTFPGGWGGVGVKLA